MNASARWQDLISENLASASTPGARKRQIAFSAVEAGMNSAHGASTIPNASVGINFEPAPLRPTGAPLDFGIDGKGFFQVQLPNGTQAYTRDGEFHLNAQGQLITKEGYSVTGAGGPIQVDPSNPAPLTVAPTGEVSQGGDTKGKLQLTEFSDPQKLTSLGQGYFTAGNGANPSDSTTSQLHQGYLESSNTSPTAEMASLITAMRMFESNQRVMQMQDERSSRTITDLGNPN